MSQGKHPIYANWQRLLLTPETLAAVFKVRPQMNVGIATGRPSGFWALDVDDTGAFQQLIDEYGALPPAFQVTGSGGLHYLFAMPPDFEPTNSAGRLPKGIDVRGTGGQIVAPPSVSAKGAYRPGEGYNATPWIPQPWLLDLVRPLPYERSGTPADQVDLTGPDGLRAASYAQAVIARECAELAEEQHGRNTKAFTVACRLHELINAGWTSYDYAEGRYLEACETASSNRPHPFPQTEAHAVWANAAHRVGDRAAELPPSALGGERLDFPQAPAAPSTSPTGGGGSSPDLATLLSSGISLSLTPSGTTPAAPASLNLPSEFWDSRPSLKHIRAAAHARIVSADVALHTVLARLSALWPHQVRLDTGVRSPIAANVFTAVVGPSSAGKTSGVGVSEDILPRPPWLASDEFADGLPLGTGEGIAEAYMGSRKVQKLDALGIPVQLKTGEMKTETVRGQVRHNAFMYADEGEALAKLVERNGSTVGEALRRAWIGSTIGQQNGRAETTRIVEKGRYSLGLVIGFQPETCQLLLADDAAGTPQRFLWCWALDASMPNDLPASPGPLADVWPREHVLPPEAGTWIIDNPPSADLRAVTYPASVRERLRVEMIERTRSGLTGPAQDGHAPAHLAKLSALLAQLEGRRDVTEEDWSLAEVIWATSCRVRDHLIEYGRSMAGKARDAQRRVRSEDAADAELSRLSVLDAAQEKAVERVALQVARRLQAGGEALTARGLRHLSASRDRGYVDDAIMRAAERRWITLTGDGTYVSGDVKL